MLLRLLSLLKAMLSNGTKESSIFEMLKRYYKSDGLTTQNDLDEVQQLTLKSVEDAKISRLTLTLAIFDSVSIKLQDARVSRILDIAATSCRPSQVHISIELDRSGKIILLIKTKLWL